MIARTCIAVLALGLLSARAETAADRRVEVRMLVTVADHMNHQPSELEPDDLSVINGGVTGIRSFEPGSDLELFVVIDDRANYDFASKLRNLREFVMAQPAAVGIGLAYVREGALNIAQDVTTDHEKVAGALRMPAGSKVANPYCAVSELMEKWPERSVRREVILVSTGMDDAAQGPVCVNADMAIREAQRASIQIFGLYNPAEGATAMQWNRVEAGVTDLAHVCYETGGESYAEGHGAAQTLVPYLTDIAEHLNHQYLVRFRILPAEEGKLQSIFLVPGESNKELMAPESVWVPALKEK